MRIWYLLLYFFRPTLSTIECELKTDTTNKFGFSESLLKNLKYDRNNSMENMKNLECFCQQEKNETSELFEDNLINEIQKIEKKWYNAQNLILRDCNYVRLVLGNGRTDFASYLSGGILHFMNIKNLIIEDLNVGVNGKTFLGVIFKNVGFEKSIQKLIFQDFLEVRLNNVSVSKNIKNVEIEMSNKDTSQDIESKLIVENSDFRTGSLTTRDTPFYFTVTNEQVQKNRCMRQLGVFRITNNFFDNFAEDTIMMTRGSEFEFNRNKIELIQEKSIQIKNVKKVLFINNFLGVPQLNAIKIMALKQPNACPAEKEPIDEIDTITFNNNKMSRSSIDFILVNAEGNPKPIDLFEKFQITNNDILVPCNCLALKEEDANSKINELIANKFTKTSNCFSNEGLVGKRSSICLGKEPTKPEEIILQKESDIKSQYVTYIVIGTIFGFTLGAIIGAGLFYFCMGDKGSITPRDTSMR